MLRSEGRTAPSHRRLVFWCISAFVIVSLYGLYTFSKNSLRAMTITTQAGLRSRPKTQPMAVGQTITIQPAGPDAIVTVWSHSYFLLSEKDKQDGEYVPTEVLALKPDTTANLKLLAKVDLTGNRIDERKIVGPITIRVLPAQVESTPSSKRRNR